MENKSELEKALARQRAAAELKQKDVEVKQVEEEEKEGDAFRRLLAQRARRLEQVTTLRGPFAK